MFAARLSLSTSVVCAVLFSGCIAETEPQGELPPEYDLANTQQASVDCTQWTDTGYTDGTAFEITLVTVDGKPAEISTANAYIVMQQAAAADGVSIKVVSGFRTYAEQQYLYNCYKNCNCNNCNLAAKPGYSNHQSGHALDLNTSSGGVLSWLNNHGGAYGFKRTVPSEDWHWEYWGGGPGGGPCNDTTPPTPCTVTTTGKTGECMDTGACAALGNHESTPGYCPGPANIQCCTSTAPDPPPDAAVEEDAEPPPGPDADVTPDAEVVQDAAPPKDAALEATVGPPPTGDAAVAQDAANPGKDGGGFYVDSSDSGGCSTASRTNGSAAFAALFTGLLALLRLRRQR